MLVFFFLLPLLALLFASGLAPLVRRFATAVGAIDHPGGRKVHAVPVPRLGGIVVFAAIVAAFAVGAMSGVLQRIFVPEVIARWMLLGGGATVLVLLGAVDDRFGLGPGRKLAVQVLAALLVTASGCVVREIPLPGGGQIVLGALAVPATVLWVLGVTNAVNLIDGLDGLAAGLALIIAATLGLVSLTVGRPDAALVAFVLAGALGGFLFFNFNPATIFLGDSGSLLVGYLLAVLGIESAHQGATATFVLTPIVALGVPIGDLLLTIARRSRRALQEPSSESASLGQIARRIVRADRQHVHHWLMQVGLTQRRAVLLLYGVCVVLNLTAILIMRAEASETTTMLVAVLAAIVVGVRVLDYRETIEQDAPRPRILQALTDAAVLVGTYAASVWIVTGFRGVVVPGRLVMHDAVVGAAVGLAALLLQGVYAPRERMARVDGRALVGRFAVAIASAAVGIALAGTLPLEPAGLAVHALAALPMLVASRWLRACYDAPVVRESTERDADDRRLRVVQLGKYFYPQRGGIETYVRQLAHGLTGAVDVDVDVIVANTRTRTVREDVDGVSVLRVGSLGRMRGAPITPLLPLHLARTGADVVHLHAPNPWAELAYLASPLAARSHLVVTWHADVVRQRRLARLWAPITRRVLARAAAICVATPKHVEASAVLPAFAHKIHVCPFGVDPDTARADAGVVQALRERFGPRPIVLGIGRLVYYKGWSVLLDAARDLDATIVIVGDGPLRGTLERRIEALGLRDRVHLVGEQADVAPYLAVCDVFVLPSTHRSEAFGIVQLEAMAFAKPVVSTRLGTGVEWVNRHGESGLTVPPGDAAALAEALAALVAQPVERLILGARAARLVRREFTTTHALVAVLAVYRQVTGMAAPASAPARPGVRPWTSFAPPVHVPHVE